MVLDPTRARAILREQQRRAELKWPKYCQDLHPRQQKFMRDKARFKVALCGRRAGKTHMDAAGLHQAAGVCPGSVNAYMGITRDVARRLAWAPLKKIARQYDLPVRFNKVELTAYHANGSEIWILGADKEEDIDKARGPAYRRFIIDETASYRSFIERLVEEAVEPALGDHRGDLWLTGNPGRVCAGFYYEASNQLKSYDYYSVHKWTVRENPFFHDPEGWLASIRKRKGWDEKHPIYRREYLGEWFHDDSALIYKYDAERNGIPVFPHDMKSEGLHLVLALDFGVVHATAFSILAFHDHDPNAYVLRSYKETDMAPSDVADEITALQNELGRKTKRDPDFVFQARVGDTGGMGKAFTKELESRHGIYVEPAMKREKLAAIDYFNGDLISGRLQVVEPACKGLVREWQMLSWPEKDGRAREVYRDGGFDDHEADATLYGHRYCRHYLATEPESTLTVGTPEWWQEQEREIEMRECEEAQRAAESPWWDPQDSH